MARPIDEPTTKILVATKTIPSGIGITAEFVAFQDVPLSEVPLGALTSFAQAYRRQPAYPIPEGCPICEDLLLPNVEVATQASFVPTGSQRVTLGIVHIRQGDKVFPPQRSLSTILSADQSVDVRVVPRNETRGRLAAMKNKVIRTFATKDTGNFGELILENATIYGIDPTNDSLTLLLAQNEAAKLTAAAKKGHLQIITRHDNGNVMEAVEGIVEATERSQSLPPPMPIALPFELPLSQNTPLEQGLSLSLPMESAPTVSLETAKRDAPLPIDIVDTTQPPTPAFVALSQSSVGMSIQSLDRFDRLPERQPAAAFPDLESDEGTLIRNDVPMVSFNMPSLNTSSHVSLERSIEQAPMSMLSQTSPTNEPELGDSARPYVETIVGPPRVSQAIQFLPPGTILSTRREYSPEIAKRTDSETLLQTIPLTTMPTETPAMPSVIPTPQILSEKARVSGYSPFERHFEQRVFTVFQGSDGGGSHSSGGIPAPSLLMKGLDTDAQAE